MALSIDEGLLLKSLRCLVPRHDKTL